MSQIKVRYSSPLKGEVSPPSDKSISHRAVILSSLAEGRSVIKNFLAAEDPMRTLEAFRQMGISIEFSPEDNTVVIEGKGLYGLKEPEGVIDCGNSGTTMRMMSGVLAGQPFSSTLTGDRYLLKRPMQRVIAPLVEMGAVITSDANGLPPLHIKGRNLSPIKYNSPVASAQVKSAILLAGLYCDGISTVAEPEKSRDHTERMLRAAGIDIDVRGLEVSLKGPSRLNPMDIRVPADFSSAAFFIVAGLIVPGSEVLVKDVGVNPTRTGLIDILIMMGADIQLLNQRDISGEPVADIYVKRSRLSGIETGGEMLLRAIDEFPILCVAAALADGTTKITGAQELRVKESDRIAAMASELAEMGVKVEELPDGIIIEGKESLKAAIVHSHGDHRIAMSMIVAGFMAQGESTIEDTDCIDTSFPGFMDMMDRLRR